MKTYFYLIFGFLFFLYSGYGFSQNVEPKEDDSHKHAVAFALSHTYISQGKIDGNRKWLAAPSLGLNYNFKLNEKWSIGLHNDIIIESFVVEDTSRDEDLLEREYPISNLIVGTCKLSEAWGVAIGGGIEWERIENFGVIRIGTDYCLELNEKGLEIVFAINYDSLIEAYDSVNFGIGINKHF